MEYKDESYDPPVNYDSETELNNIKDATCSVGSPFDDKNFFSWNGFTHNNIHTDGRQGGPMADNDPLTSKKGASAGGKQQKIGECGCCEAQSVSLWHGNHYRCHDTDQMKQEHAYFCKECAEGYDEDGEAIQCPRHGLDAKPFSDCAKIPLEKVMMD